MTLRKALWPLFAITTLLHGAADPAQIRNLENRVSTLENRKGATGVINPPARPVVKGVDLFFQGDALVWQASESGLEYAVDNNTSSTYLSHGRILKPHFEWDWGFKLAAGYNTMHDGWDLFLQWTRFYTDNTHSTTASSSGAIFPSFVNQADPSSSLTDPGLTPITTGFSSVSGYWKLHLNVLDLELGKEFYVSKWLTLRPHAGLRSAWIRQKLNAAYSNGHTSFIIGDFIIPVATPQIATHNRNNFWGMGLRAGLDGNWGLGKGISIFSDLAAAILLGHFHVKQTECDNYDIPPSIRLKVHEEYRAARATLDLSMGLRYDHSFCDDNYAFMLQIGWEQHMFFSQNQLKKFLGINSTTYNYSGLFESSQDDLTTQGVTFTARFNF